MKVFRHMRTPESPFARLAAGILGRLRRRKAAYRPEKHYMRGAGPKSRQRQTDSGKKDV